MVRTSIQACGTATTTLAWPKPSGVSRLTRSSARAMVSRTRSSPVTPRWAAPAASWPAISEAERKSDLDVGHAGERAAIVAGAALLHEAQAGAAEEGGGVLLQPALGGDGEEQRASSGALIGRLPRSGRARTSSRRPGPVGGAELASAAGRSGRRRPAAARPARPGRASRRRSRCSSRGGGRSRPRSGSRRHRCRGPR